MYEIESSQQHGFKENIKTKAKDAGFYDRLEVN
jgi:hypothetical protein